jgi:hypothetical protein
MMNIFSCRNIFWYRSGFYFRICFIFGSGFCFRIRIPILGMNRNQLKVWLQVRRCRRRKVRAGFASDSTDFCDCEYCSLFASTCIMVEKMERLRTGACKKTRNKNIESIALDLDVPEPPGCGRANCADGSMEARRARLVRTSSGRQALSLAQCPLTLQLWQGYRIRPSTGGPSCVG